ncbi:Flp pilus assembly protein CpaB [soil metagenome]
MNPRQRRGVLLMGLSLVGAVAVFVAVSGYVGDVQRQVGEMQPVLRLTADIGAFQPVPPDAVEIVDVPARWRPQLALGSMLELTEQVAGTDMLAGTVLEQGDLVTPPQIGPGERQIAILVDVETGVAGNIGVGDIVDVIATRQSFDNEAPRAEIAIQVARILSIGTPQTDETVDPVTGAFAGGQVVPITFVLPTSDVLRLAYVESFATNVRLALRAPGDRELLDLPERVFAPESATAGAS